MGRAGRQNGVVTTLDWCRHCTERNVVMTREHLPPRSAGNDQAISVLDGEGTLIEDFTEGHAIPTLCEGCNKGASDRRLPLAYKLWHEDVVEAINARAAAASVVGGHRSRAVDVDHDYAVHPGRIARQVLGMLLAVQSRPSLTEEHPQLREAYFSEEEGQSIEPLTLHLALANTGFGYLRDVMEVVMKDPRDGTVQLMDLRLWSFPPFVAFLVDGSVPGLPALRIDDWLAHPTSRHFHKRDRHVSYPIADRRNLVIATILRLSSR